MENNQINTKTLYFRGLMINFMPVLITGMIYLLLGGDGPGIGFFFYLLFFFFLIFLYCIYFFLREERILEHKIKRRIILFSPFLFSIVVIISLCSYYEDNDIIQWFLVYSPFLIITFIYALYLEITLRKKIKQKESIEKSKNDVTNNEE